MAVSIVDLFDGAWRVLARPPLVAEYRFDPPRRYRFDRAHVASKVAIELEGGVWTGGRHTSSAGFRDDAIKYNRAAALGWAVFRLTIDMIRDDPVGNVTPIIQAIEERSNPLRSRDEIETSRATLATLLEGDEENEEVRFAVNVLDWVLAAEGGDAFGYIVHRATEAVVRREQPERRPALAGGKRRR